MKNIHYIDNLQDPGFSSTTVCLIFMMHPGETTKYFQLFQDAVRDRSAEKGSSEFNKLLLFSWLTHKACASQSL